MSFLTLRSITNRYWTTCTLGVQVRNFAARKGTRERKQKKKARKEEEKPVGFIPHNQRNKEAMLAARKQLKFDDSHMPEPTDDAYCLKNHKFKIYPFKEAVQNHRETHHPTMYNEPNAPLHVTIELYMQGEKKTRFVENFTRVVALPFPYDHGENRNIIVFAKKPEDQKAAIDAGAEFAGGIETVKAIQNGNINLQNFTYVIAHPDILPEIVALRGLMKNKFPNPKNGTLNLEIAETVKRYLYGLTYTAKKDEYEKDFGVINTILGTLEMDAEHLEENFRTLIQDVNKMKPRRAGHFISRCLLWSPPTKEKFKVDHNLYLESIKSDPTPREEDLEEERGEQVAL